MYHLYQTDNGEWCIANYFDEKNGIIRIQSFTSLEEAEEYIDKHYGEDD